MRAVNCNMVERVSYVQCIMVTDDETHLIQLLVNKSLFLGFTVIMFSLFCAGGL